MEILQVARSQIRIDGIVHLRWRYQRISFRSIFLLQFGFLISDVLWCTWLDEIWINTNVELRALYWTSLLSSDPHSTISFEENEILGKHLRMREIDGCRYSRTIAPTITTANVQKVSFFLKLIDELTETVTNCNRRPESQNILQKDSSSVSHGKHRIEIKSRRRRLG